MRQFYTRTIEDRRRQPTPVISRFTVRGLRKMFRRKEDQERGGYVDRYHSALLTLLTLTLGLTVLDALFTMMILDDGGWEINPVVRSVIQLYGDRFWVWKFVIVSFPLTLLCLHSKFRCVIPVISGVTAMSIVVVLYQIFLYFF